MEDLLKWLIPTIIPLAISVTTALITSRNTIKHVKEETAKEIAKVNAEMQKEIEVIKAQKDKEIELYKLQMEDRKAQTNEQLVNQLGAPFMAEILSSLLQGKDPNEMAKKVNDLKAFAEGIKNTKDR